MRKDRWAAGCCLRPFVPRWECVGTRRPANGNAVAKSRSSTLGAISASRPCLPVYGPNFRHCQDMEIQVPECSAWASTIISDFGPTGIARQPWRFGKSNWKMQAKARPWPRDGLVVALHAGYNIFRWSTLSAHPHDRAQAFYEIRVKTCQNILCESISLVGSVIVTLGGKPVASPGGGRVAAG